MFKRNSGFTLIELIVVITVLGILAAIIVPNISSFQNEARDVQLTADVRNLQTALDMYRAKSLDGISEPLTGFKVLASHQLEDDGTLSAIAGGDQFQLLDVQNGLYPTYLRKAPKYVVNHEFAADVAVGDKAKLDFTKGQVVVGTMQEKSVDAGTDGTLGTADDVVSFNGSTAIVKAVSIVDNAGTDVLAVVR